MDLITSEKTVLAISVVAMIGGGYYLIRTHKSTKEHKKIEIRLADAQGCKDIIQAKSICIHDPNGDQILKNLILPSDARARPNRRLIHAFGIDNCFTIGERSRCTEFKNEAKKLVDLDDDQWTKLASSIRDLTRQQCSPSGKISLFEMIQLVTMKATLDPLLGVGVSSSNVDEHISQLAKEINQQWLRSKEVNGPETAFAAQETINRALRAIMPGWNCADDTRNPLNLILPGYETLCRVVLRCFIEVVYRSGSASQKWRRVLQDFASNPKLFQFHSTNMWYDYVSANMIVEEALRLYPPTRRIY